MSTVLTLALAVYEYCSVTNSHPFSLYRYNFVFHIHHRPLVSIQLPLFYNFIHSSIVALYPYPTFLTMRDILVGLALVSFLVALTNSISVGVGWWALNTFSCQAMVYDYVKFVTISSTVLLTSSLIILFLALFSLTSERLATFTTWLATFFGFSFLLLGALLSIAWFIWGIVALSQDDNCKSTPFFAISIWFVVSGGLSILSSRTRSS